MAYLGAFATAVAVLLVPGGVVAALLRLRGGWWLGLAPVISLAVLGASAVGGAWVDMPFSAWTLLAGTAVAAGLALVARLSLRGLRGAGRWDRAALGTAIAIVSSGTVIGLLAFGGHNLSGVLSQSYDGVFHLNAVAFILDTGNASSFDLYSMTMQGGGNEFYPAAWHALVALTAQSSGATIVASTNIVWIVTSGLVWTSGMALFTATALRGRVREWAAAIMGAVLASCSGAFPFLLLSWGTLYPTGLAYAVLPSGLTLALAVLRGWEGSRGLAWTLGAVWAVAMTFSHPRSLFSFVALVLPLLALAGLDSARQRWSTRRGRRRVLAVAGGALVLGAGVVAVGWWYVYRTFGVAERPISDHLNGGPATARQGIGDALAQVVAHAPLLAPHETASAPFLLLALATLVGAAFAVRRHEVRWLVLSLLVVAVLYALASGSNSDLAKIATGIWYKDKYRLLALLPTVAIPLAVLAAVELGRLVARGRTRIAASAMAATLALVALTSWGTVVWGGTRASIDDVFVIRDAKHGALLDSGQFSLLTRLPDLVPEDAIVVGDPWDGSALSWAIGERKAMFPHFTGEWTADEYLVASWLDYWDRDPAVCDAVTRTGAAYLLHSKGSLWGDPPEESRVFAGLTRAVGTDLLTLVASEGGTSLYRITGCDSSAGGH